MVQMREEMLDLVQNPAIERAYGEDLSVTVMEDQSVASADLGR